LKRVFLAGEGRNELGGWCDRPEYRDSTKRGVLEALLKRAVADGWRVVDAIPWRLIRKYKVGAFRTAETRNILGLVLRAREADAEVVAFSRDKDSEKAEGEERERSVRLGIEEAGELFPDGPEIVGGMAVQRLESWVLASAGVAGTERMHAAVDALLQERNIAPKDTSAMVEQIDRAALDRLPQDAVSLRTWLARARRALGENDARTTKQ
jgi:hypothetical protein